MNEEVVTSLNPVLMKAESNKQVGQVGKRDVLVRALKDSLEKFPAVHRGDSITGVRREVT